MANHRVPKATVSAAAALAGGHVALAKRLGVTYQAVNYWLRAGAPAWRRRDIEEYMTETRKRRKAATEGVGA